MLKKIKENNTTHIIALWIIILFSILRITYLFVNERNGFHSDELWSYGYANSFYNPYIYEIRGDNRVDHLTTQNIGEWISGETLNDYIVVNEGEEFRFDSVIDNKRGDNSPALYELLLHFVCSFFPDVFSWWFGFSIQLVFLVLTLLILYDTAKKLLSDDDSRVGEWGAVSCCLLYSCSIGFTNTFLFIRMYGMLTFFCLCLVRVSFAFIKYSVLSYKGIIKSTIAVFCVTLLGGYTHFYYFIFAFFYTAFFCVTLVWKRWKEAITFGLLQVMAVALYFFAYPDAWVMLTTYRESSKPAASGLLYIWDIRLAYTFLFRGTLGIVFDFNRVVFGPLFVAGIFFLLVLFMFGYVFRHEKWVKSIIRKAKEWMHRHNIVDIAPYIGLCGTILIYPVFVAKFSNFRSMGDVADRYLMSLFPCASILIASVLYRILVSAYNHVVVLLSILTYVFLITLGIINHSSYLFSEMNTKELEDICYKRDVVALMPADWELTWLAGPLRLSNEVYAFSYNVELNPEDGIRQYFEQVPDTDGKSFVLLVSKDVFADENTEFHEDGSIDMLVTGDLLHGIPRMMEKDWLNLFSQGLSGENALKYVKTVNTFLGKMDVFRFCLP